MEKATATEQLAAAVKAKVEKWYRVKEASEVTGFGRSFLYERMATGELKSRKVHGARRIPESALAEFQARFDGSGEVATAGL